MFLPYRIFLPYYGIITGFLSAKFVRSGPVSFFIKLFMLLEVKVPQYIIYIRILSYRRFIISCHLY